MLSSFMLIIFLWSRVRTGWWQCGGRLGQDGSRVGTWLGPVRGRMVCENAGFVQVGGQIVGKNGVGWGRIRGMLW